MNGRNPTTMSFSQERKTVSIYGGITGVFVQAIACEWREKVHNIYLITSIV